MTIAPTISTDEPAATLEAAPVKSWRYAVGLLTLVYTLNFLDRQIVNILAEPIKKDLMLHDWQIGVVTGLAFAVIYTFAAIPVARLAERTHRPRLIATALTVWSGFTVVCGLAQGFVQLASARLFVGLGESGCAPAAHSLITQYAPKEKRAFAFGIFNAGLPIGSLIGLALGGLIADRLGWRAAFMLAGLPGLLVAVLVAFTLTETRRGLKTVTPPKSSTFVAEAKVLLAKKAYPRVAFAAGLYALKGYGFSAFVASFFFRVHPAQLKAAAAQLSAALGTTLGPAAVLGPSLAVITGLTGIVATIVGGVVTDRMAKRDLAHYGTVPAIPHFIAAPFLIAGLFWPGLIGSLTLLAIAYFLSSLSAAPIWTSVQSLSPAPSRATASAIALLVTVLLGLGVGPVMIGLISDTVGLFGVKSGASLRVALLLGDTPGIVGAIILWRTRKYFRTEMET